jgi:hypothetical protein
MIPRFPARTSVSQSIEKRNFALVKSGADCRQVVCPGGFRTYCDHHQAAIERTERVPRFPRPPCRTTPAPRCRGMTKSRVGLLQLSGPRLPLSAPGRRREPRVAGRHYLRIARVPGRAPPLLRRGGPPVAAAYRRSGSPRPARSLHACGFVSLLWRDVACSCRACWWRL